MRDSHDIQIEESHWKKVIEDADINKDGELSFEEFETAMITIIERTD